MDEQPKIPLPSTERERLRRVEEVCQHAVYLLQEREAGGLDRVAGESSFVVHFYHRRFRRDILAVRRYIWGATEAPIPIRSGREVLEVRRIARLKKNLTALGIDTSRLDDVSGRVGRRWNDLRLGDAALLLAARSGLPASLPAVWYSTKVNYEAGTGILYQHWLSEPESVREAHLVRAAEEERSWDSQVVATITLRVFTNAAVADVLREYERAKYSLLDISGEEIRQLVMGPELAFETDENFLSEVPCLELAIATAQTLPDKKVLESWVTKCLRKHSGRLPAGGSHLSYQAIRLWTTSALVDFTGLSNRAAMNHWNVVLAASFDVPAWEFVTGGETQTAESSFAHARKEVLAPRMNFYLRLLNWQPPQLATPRARSY